MQTQLNHFNGPDYVPEFDDERLTGQLKGVFNLVTKTPERIGNIPVCGNCLAEIYEKGKKVSKVEHNS